MMKKWLTGRGHNKASEGKSAAQWKSGAGGERLRRPHLLQKSGQEKNEERRKIFSKGKNRFLLTRRGGKITPKAMCSFRGG